jgi:2-polyprenyl-3-methyl-5-hydroxy-6-metoxy-1,4-benzoquinol methylase
MAVYTPDKYKHDERDPLSAHVYKDAPLSFLPQPLAGKRVLDLGCGNGYWSNRLRQLGAEPIGIDGSTEGITIARQKYPGIRFEQLLATDTVLSDLGVAPFDAVLSVEVIEHIYDPRGFVRSCMLALKPGGTLVLTTPYNGYLKSLALSLAGKWDFHLNPLWDGGHIKFWSRHTLTTLLTEAGFRDVTFAGYGRAPYMWMGMVLSGKRAG